jgi:muramoyltetrapeptide carboxypeptidase LdcA involved in peptidoglycan recycling
VPVVAPKLRPGSPVRVIAPSRSLAIIGPGVRAEAGTKLAALGLTVSFGEHAGGCDDFCSSPVRRAWRTRMRRSRIREWTGS